MAKRKHLAERVPAPLQPPKAFQVFSGFEKHLTELEAQFQFSDHRLFLVVFVSLVPFAWRAFEGQEPTPSWSDVFFTMCLSMGNSLANLPAYPYTA